MANLKQLGSDALQVIKAVAPTIATAWGGPVAGLAVQKLEGVFGGPGSVTDAALLNATPDQIAAMKKAEDDFKLQIEALGVQLDALQFADTASARQREETVRDWTPRILAFGVVTVCLGLEGCMLLGAHFPTKIAPEILGRIMGTLDAAVILVLGYYFGSSAGARSSAESLAQIAKQP